ncbi:MAG: acyl carrier protein [Acaryochloridaceae cyanobacterium CSU_3_4]|nr:acyl carrier protein [Acaryochloridaceae cyanobacterium CSU_3_4]
MWFQVLRCEERDISVTGNFFSLGGHSLLFIELYHRYQAVFAFNSTEISIALFLQRPTIREHATLLQQVTQMNIELMRWYPLHLVQGNRAVSCFSYFTKSKCQHFSNCFFCSTTHLSR